MPPASRADTAAEGGDGNRGAREGQRNYPGQAKGGRKGGATAINFLSDGKEWASP